MADVKIQAHADPLAEQKCPACGGTTRFDPEKGKLVCEYCGTVVDIPEPAEEMQLEGFDFENLNDQAADPNAADLPVYNCVSCGAEVIAPAEQIALTCPFCRNNIVLTDKVSGKMRPDGVIPFKISSKELPGAVRRYYKGKDLLPRNFFSESTMGNVTGIYVPFWVFSGKGHGDLDFNGEKSSSYRDGDYNVTDTDHYLLKRRVSMDFKDIPLNASVKVSDDLADSVEPFDMSEVKPFDMRYLAGFTADRFDVPKETTAEKAKQLIASSADNIACNNIHEFSGVSRRSGSLNLDLEAKYLLFPLYLFDIQHGGQKYPFTVNGQTGKVAGKLPTDGTVSLLYFLKRVGILAAAGLAIAAVMFLGGM